MNQFKEILECVLLVLGIVTLAVVIIMAIKEMLDVKRVREKEEDTNNQSDKVWRKSVDEYIGRLFSSMAKVQGEIYSWKPGYTHRDLIERIEAIEKQLGISKEEDKPVSHD